jgi:hypothetical protein
MIQQGTVAAFHCVARIVPVKRGTFAGTLADFPDELGEGVQRPFGRTLHGRGEVEECALFDKARKILPELFFNREPVAMQR